MKISIKNVNKKFKNTTVLEDVNIELEEGKIYLFVGQNGSGKTILLKLICGIYAPTEGEILFNGKLYNKIYEYVPDTRALIEKPAFFPNLTGLENLKMLAKIQNKIKDEEINNALKIVNLYEERNKKYSKYSLGMKQKLGIAQAIMEKPNIILLDEPFNGIEKSSVKKIIDYLITEKKKGKIIIISSHILDELNDIADKIFYFENGKVKEKNELSTKHY